jgi:non-ribosomal peptide synthetase component F
MPGAGRRELNARSNQLAHLLISKGVGANSVVGLMMDRTPMYIVCMVAAYKAGGCWTPLEESLPEDRLAGMAQVSPQTGPSFITRLTHISCSRSLHAACMRLVPRMACADQGAWPALLLQDSNAKVVLAHSYNVARAKKMLAEMGVKAEVVDLDAFWADSADKLSSTNPAPGRSGLSDLAYILFTSGSTGRPKGVMIGHRAMNDFITHCIWYAKLDNTDVGFVTAAISVSTCNNSAALAFSCAIEHTACLVGALWSLLSGPQ